MSWEKSLNLSTSGEIREVRNPKQNQGHHEILDRTFSLFSILKNMANSSPCEMTLRQSPLVAFSLNTLQLPTIVNNNQDQGWKEAFQLIEV